MKTEQTAPPPNSQSSSAISEPRIATPEIGSVNLFWLAGGSTASFTLTISNPATLLGRLAVKCLTVSAASGRRLSKVTNRAFATAIGLWAAVALFMGLSLAVVIFTKNPIAVRKASAIGAGS